MMMRTILAIFALCMLFAPAAMAVEVGSQGPNFTFDKSWHALENAKQLEDYRGKAVLLEVWATW
jgi:hypothetical protein